MRAYGAGTYGRRMRRLALIPVLVLAIAPPAHAIPGLGRPEAVAKFRVVVEGAQHTKLEVDGNRWRGANPNCSTFSWRYRVSEEWRFLRGAGTIFVFERYRGGLVMFKRQRGAARSFDTSFAAVGDVRRTASGGLRETGGPGCRGESPVSQQGCDRRHPVRSPLALLWTGRRLTLDRSPASVRLRNPADACGNMPFGSYGLQSPYPLLLRARLTPLTANQIFGRRGALVIAGTTNPLPSELGTEEVVATSDSDMSVTVRLIRV